MKAISEQAEILGELVRHEREVRGLSLREAAQQCGVSFSTLSRTEHHQAPTFENFVLIARWLKLDGFR